jgi:hypothetical protein
MAGKDKIVFQSWKIWDEKLQAYRAPQEDEQVQVLMENVLKTGRPMVRYGAVLFLIMYDEQSGFTRQAMSKDDLLAEFAGSTLWMKREKKETPVKEGEAKYRSYPDAIPRGLIRVAYGKKTLEDNVYEVKNIMTFPIVSADGEIILRNGLSWKEKKVGARKMRRPDISIEDGYDDKSRVFFAAPERVMARISGINDLKPTDKQMLLASEILDDFICDFTFASDSARASALAFMLTMVSRELIGENVPMLEVSAPKSQSGKTKLVTMMLAAITGEEPNSFTPNFRDTKEFEQEYFSQLLQGQPYIFMDDVGNKVRSNFLNSALTKGKVSKRYLGISSMVTVNSNIPHVMTANNPELSQDIKNRVYLLRILKPPKNKFYKHEFPVKYALEKGPDVLWALFVYYQHWNKNCGRPLCYDAVMEGYYEWSVTYGGMLQAAGVTGFLTDTLKQIDEPEPAEIKAGEYAAALYQAIGERWVFVRELADLGTESEPGLGRFAVEYEAGRIKKDDSKSSREQSLAGFLGRLEATPLPGGYKFLRDHDERYGSKWRVTRDAGGNG